MSEQVSGDSAQRIKIMGFIAAYVAENAYPPSVREIGAAVGMSSPSTVHAHLRELERQGRIRRGPGPRMLAIVYEAKS